MVSLTNERALEMVIEKALTGTCLNFGLVKDGSKLNKKSQ